MHFGSGSDPGYLYKQWLDQQYMTLVDITNNILEHMTQGPYNQNHVHFMLDSKKVILIIGKDDVTFFACEFTSLIRAISHFCLVSFYARHSIVSSGKKSIYFDHKT